MTAPPPPLRPNLRDEFLLAPGLTFLNHGSFGAVPRVVFDAQQDCRRRIEADPIEVIARRSPALLEEVKAVVGPRFGMTPANFGFVTNATEGVNAVLRGLHLLPGDELLTTNHVYHAVRQTMRHAAARAGATVREVQLPLPIPSAESITVAITAALTDRTRLLVVDHVTSPTGLVFPVAEIVAACRSRGVDVLVDGAHAPGMLPLDVEALNPTYYAANLHKWALAPKGTAVLWVSPSHQADVHPAVVSHALGDGFAAEFAWQGTRDLSAWLTAPAGLAYLADLRFDAVLAYNRALATWARDLLTARWHVPPIAPPALLGSLAAVPLPGKLAALDPAALGALQQRLHDEHQIEVPLVPWPTGNLLRVSAQVYNRPEEYERLADVIGATDLDGNR